jgi:MoaA/NifB/PqqE/SkfB family radical SAM enzyme
MPLNFNRKPAAGETRDCTDPWKFVILRSNGDVSLCCRSRVLGNTRQQPIQEILEGPDATRMRETLLTGELSRDCIECSTRGVTSLEGLRRRVEQELYHDPLAELHDLRRQVREHREQASTLFRERAALKAHIQNLERERAILAPDAVHDR